MMRLIVNGEPYVYIHKCSAGEKEGSPMSLEGVRRFLVDALYESFCRCGCNIRKVNDVSWKYQSAKDRASCRLCPSNLKQLPDLVYRLSGDPNDTWFYVMPEKEDMSLIDLRFIAESVESHGILPVLIVGDVWCFDTNGQENICGASFAAKFETISLLNEENPPLPELLSQKQLIEKLASCWRHLDASIIEPYLDKDFHYTSDAVFYEMSSRYEYMGYLRAKFKRLRDGSNPIGVKMGLMGGTNDFALLLHQGAYNQSLLLTIKVNEGRIVSMRMCEYED